MVDELRAHTSAQLPEKSTRSIRSLPSIGSAMATVGPRWDEAHLGGGGWFPGGFPGGFTGGFTGLMTCWVVTIGCHHSCVSLVVSLVCINRASRLLASFAHRACCSLPDVPKTVGLLKSPGSSFVGLFGVLWVELNSL